MSPPISTRPIKYIAEVKRAREVTLFGAADYQYWADHLADENLVPAMVNNRAEVLLSAVESKWMGVRFNELSVSVTAHERSEPANSGIFLAAAFNTSRVFSLIERYVFHTPYRHSHVDVSVCDPWSFQLVDNAERIVLAKRHCTAVSNESDTIWEVTIFLPSRRGRTQEKRELFFARLSGVTQVARFSASSDLVELTRSKRHPIAQLLIDSNFTGVEWRVRNNATHARSKTYRRAQIV